jgi:hypothetical protein
MRWVTAQIVNDIGAIPGIASIEIQEPGGDHDTDALYVTVVGTDTTFWVRGFDPESDYLPNRDTSLWDVPMAELTDGNDSRGGLNSDDEEAALAYVRIRKYLSGRGLEVVRSLDEYF